MELELPYGGYRKRDLICKASVSSRTIVSTRDVLSTVHPSAVAYVSRILAFA